MCSALVELSAEILEVLARLVNLESLVRLSTTCCSLLGALGVLIEARCKRECFSTYLHPTVSAYRMQAAVPATWRQLYAAFSSLRNLRWETCRGDGASSSLRALKSDNQEYEVDTTTAFLIRSGGHYWFSVLQARMSEATLGGKVKAEEDTATRSGRLNALPFLQSPQQVTMGKWEKIRATGKGPCPRRNHSMSCLPSALCVRELMKTGAVCGGGAKSEGVALEEEEDKCMDVRRILFFGGQSEGIPFEAFGDLYLLCIEEAGANSSRKARAVWVESNVTGQAPSPRCGHRATLLSPELLLITGGSMGVSPILKMDIFLLHIDGCVDFRWSTPSCFSRVPTGRSLHEVYRCVCACHHLLLASKRSQSMLANFGSQSTTASRKVKCSFMAGAKLQVTTDVKADFNDTHYSIEWSEPRLSGSLPCSRRGHSTNIIGPNLLLFGGQDDSTGQLENDVRVLNLKRRRWSCLDVPGEAPCPRRGFKNQYFGTTLVISSGFVRSTQSGKANHQLPDSDVHVLSLL